MLEIWSQGREFVVGVRIGIDVGEKSLGLAAVDYDDAGWPVEILAAVSHIHDGGMDPDTAKSPQSRLATAGVARRTRRLVRNRRRRLRMLDDLLSKHGLPVPDVEVSKTHDAWYARALLSTTWIAEDDRREELLSLALRHMARHRGWRNPWWSFERLSRAQSPSEALTATIEKAIERFGQDVVGEPSTLGQLVAAVTSTRAAIRPTKGALADENGPVMSEQVKQEDTLAEARLIMETQRLDERAIDEISRALMFAAAPTIPAERIGKCALIPSLPRSSTAGMEFQEYRVRAAVANLRIRPEGRRLTDEEYDRVCEMLLGWRDVERPRWRDVAEELGVSPRQLAQPDIDQEGGGSVPVDRTSIRIEVKCKPKSTLGAWWRSAAPDERADFVDFVTDLSGAVDEPASDAVAQLLSTAPDDVAEVIESLELESGRSPYSREALSRILDVMRSARCGVHTARKQAFDLPDDWAPPQPTFDDAVEHPTVSRINALVRRFLITASQRWGTPEAVVIEQVRGGFMGPTGLAELKREINYNTARRDRIKTDLAQQGIERPSNTDVRRWECIQRQNSQCLYCGGTIGMSTSELDHIVPRAGGGGGRRDNLVAVCRPCNAGKGRLPFAVFAAASGNSDVTVSAALDRVKAWQAVPGMTAKQLARLRKDVSRRLQLTQDDEDGSDQSLESTAYAARQMRARIQSFLRDRGSSPDLVQVYAGAVTSEARKAGGIDDKLRLRDFTRKSRFDRRHHAVDAVVLTSLRTSVAATLKARTNLFAEHRETGKVPGWKDYRGAGPGDVVIFEDWAQRVGVLADLLRERIDADRIPVVRQLRLTPRIGALHADTVEKLDHADLNGPLTQSDIRRVVNSRLFRQLTDEAAGGDLPADPSRADRLDWQHDRPVDLHPSNAAYLPVRGGAVAIGATARYARVYAWETKTGFNYGMVRMYVGELARLGLAKAGTDLFTIPLPEDSQAIRTAPPALIARIRTGAARQVGWLALNDEIELDPAVWITKGGKVGRFMEAAPENSWYLSGFFGSDKISLTPTKLALEGVDEGTPESIREVLAANRIPLALNVVMGAPGTTIIRRTITGSVRWQNNGLPASWRPRDVAQEAFGR
jgi:CRISPR-associated endonuclease Csn1